LKITDILKHDRPVLSLEFFPPNSSEEMEQLLQTLKSVKRLDPGFISVTYGAGGGTRDKTLDIVERAKSQIGLESAAHVTCIGHSKSEVSGILDGLVRAGIENVVALRGDPPKGEPRFTPHPRGFHHANELTAFIRASYDLCIAVAGYPEGHIESPDKEADWAHLQEKVKAGADLVITQLFFENEYFFEFERRMREIGVSVPIIPRIMPITNYQQILRFTRVCGASIPDTVVRDLEAVQNQPELVHRYGVEYATKQCRALIEHGVPGVHFYTLNRSRATQEIIGRLRD